MHDLYLYALLGVGSGALYALTALGITAIARASGVVNFAQAAFGLAASLLFYELRYNSGWPLWISLVCGLIFPALLGVLTHNLIMRPLRNYPPLSRVIATLGIYVVITSIAALQYGTDVLFVQSILPTGSVSIFGATLGEDRLWLLGLSAVLTVVMWAVFRFTTLGRRTSAVAEDRQAAAALGVSPDWVATVNWGIGGMLAGLGGIFLSPILGLSVGTMSLLLVPALAAALLGRMASFPLTFAGGVLIGVTQSVMSRYVTTPGAIDAVPFLIIVAVLMLSGERFSPRTARLTRFAAVGSGRIRWPVFGAFIAVVLAYAWLFASKTWVDALIFSAGWAIILLSLVVVTGFAGQLSLAQVTLAGIGAWVAGRLADAAGVPMVLGLVGAVIVAIPVGLILGFPAIRTRGVNLAVITLGFSVTIESMIFNNPNLTGGATGTALPEFKIFGVSFDVVQYPERYFTFSLIVLVVAVVAIANVRRGRPGRSMLAVRSNERAAASMGISVVTAKLYAFAIGSAVAAAGGVILSYRSRSPVYYEFASGLSIESVAIGTIGGIAWIAGAPFGSQLLPGSVFARLASELFSGIGKYLPLIGGVGLILMLIQAPDGLAKFNVDEVRRLAKKVRPARRSGATKLKPVVAPAVASGEPVRVASCTFAVADLSVRFGGVEALSSVSLEAHAGEIVGLIGPNGAGKSTFIEAVTGFVEPATGDVVFNGESIRRLSPAKRARSGIGRSFQSLELFEDMSVADNLRTACDDRSGAGYFLDVVWPHTSPLSQSAWAAIREFQLEDALDRRPTELPYAQRRLVAIAGAIATEPSLLLLDEPAAGLDATESRELGALLRRLASEWGMAIVLVEHDIDLVMQVCDRIVVLEFGSVIGMGTPSEIQQHPEVIRAYLGATAEELPDTAELPTPIGNAG